MKSAGELIKNYTIWRDGKISHESAIDLFFNSLIDIMDHLERTNETLIYNFVDNDRIRREAMIEALRWTQDMMGYSDIVQSAIERIKNGGEL